jgi:hypothetical protein
MADPALSSDYDTMIFTEEFHATRLQILDDRASESMSPDMICGVQLQGGLTLPGPSPLLGQIHIAAIAADPLAVCELIRLGAAVDLQDSDGHTALNIAMSFIGTMTTMGATMSASVGLSPTHIARSKYIVRTLIEQHADLNHTAKNALSPLHWASVIRNWDLIALLLRHGANPPQSSRLSTIFPDIRERNQFRALVKDSVGQKRPPQLCPCWSGNLLQDCHAVEVKQAYPHDFYCTCGSKKSYGRCCARRKTDIFEVWNQKDRYLQRFYIRPAGLVTIGDERTTTDEMVRAHYISVPRDYLDGEGLSEEEAFHFLGPISEALLAQNLIDPAFAFAMKEAQFLPR